MRALSTSASAAHAEDVFDTLEEQVKSSYNERYSGEDRYGFAILSIVLVAAISAIVQCLIKWWLEKRLNKSLMESWHDQYRSADSKRDPAKDADSEQRAGDE